MIELTNISKSYGQVEALKGVSLKIPKGKLFGLIGPDGAGKTTLFRIITTLLIPDSGKATVFGKDTVKDFRSIRKFTGYMPGRFSLYPDLTVMENLNFYATIFGTTVEKNYEIIRPVFSLLEPFRDRLAGRLSGGMKQKLALCCALIHNPEILVLDEPTTGVDAVSRKEFWETLYLLRDNGMTILVSTPYMDEASKCDHVGLMQHGRVVREDSPAAVLEGFKYPLLGVKTSNMPLVLNKLRDFDGVRRAYLFGRTIHVVLDMDRDENWLIKKAESEGLPELRIFRIQPHFEDCFIEAVI